MLARLAQHAATAQANVLRTTAHVLVVLPAASTLERLDHVPGIERLKAALARRELAFGELVRTPVAIDDADGLVVFCAHDPDSPRFVQQSAMRKACAALLAERPRRVLVAVYGSEAERRSAARAAVYDAWINGVTLPSRRKSERPRALGEVALHGWLEPDGFAADRAIAAGSLLARSLTMLPPNELTPRDYRVRLRRLAKQYDWRIDEWDMARLRRMGAGAFVAVAQGSEDDSAAIVRLRYRPRHSRHTVSLVGKGICFDTGGHNLKPAKHMYGMHEDMNGSAVALGIFFAATLLRLPVRVECWLAIAQNHLGPAAYKQNDVVTALDGTTIEIVHTDAEGRMVLSDTLTLAARQEPDLMVDFATLTGSMHVALGTRYSGVFCTEPGLARSAVDAGNRSGERVAVFPLDADYDAALESKIADVKQCTPDGDADHILAARFLQRFTAGRPWIHVDLSAASCDGGLGACASNVTGFGVGWGIELLTQWLAERAD